MKKTFEEIAALLGGEILGEDRPQIAGATNIEEAGPEDITFAVPPHMDKAACCQAAAVIVPRQVTEFAKPAIRVDSPRSAFAKLLSLFHPPLAVKRGIHPTAVVGENVTLGSGVAVMAHAVISDDVVIGDNSVIYPGVYIGEKTVIGSDCILYSNVTVREGCCLGDRVILYSGAVIGSDGFGYITDGGHHYKVPQVGNVVLGDDVEIGANSAVDRATTGSTIVKRGTKVDNMVHIAHNVVVGEDCYLVAFTGIAGSAKIGNRVTFAGQSGSAGHVTIGDNSVFAAKSGVIGDVPPNSFYAGFPALPHAEWLRSVGTMRKVPDLLKKVREMEKRLKEMEQKK